MSIKLGINGLGRIGKLVLRLTLAQNNIEVVHINDMMNTELMAHLLKYDSIHGKLNASVTFDDNHIIINDKPIRVTNATQPSEIPWEETGTEFVVDSSGRFKTYSTLEGHLKHGVKRVVLSCPPDDYSIERVVVMGVNQNTILPSDRIISNASCTTNCVAIMLKVLLNEFGIENAFMNTIHPTTNNQNLQDGYHSDYRRARSAINNIIPTTSSAVRSVHRIFPELKEKFKGFATRIPILDCSYVEVCAMLQKEVTRNGIISAFQKYSSDPQMCNFLEFTQDPIVSSDITDNPHSAIFDALATQILGNRFIQILGWYDNEYGYSSRTIDLINYIA